MTDQLLLRAYEVVRHSPECSGFGRADEYCNCDAVAFLNDLAAIAMARDSAETACPAPVPQDCQARAESIAQEGAR